MDLQTHLKQGFEYDLWANLQWIEVLPRFTSSGRAHAVLDHILGAQRIWLERVGGVVPSPDLERGDRARSSAAEWTRIVSLPDPGRVIAYHNLSGVPFSNTFEHIALHVINHGTYHRGHLRGLADAEGLTDFPETDLIRFYREA